MTKFNLVFLLLPFWVFSQKNKETYFTEDGLFCSIHFAQNDTTWTFGKISLNDKFSDSISVKIFVQYDASNSFQFGELENYSVSKQNFDFETNRVENDFYLRKFGVLSSRFTCLLLEKGDYFLLKTRDYSREYVKNWFNGLNYFLTFVENDSLQFLKIQLSNLSATSDFGGLAKTCFEEKKYELALYYSKLFLILNDVNSDSYSEIAMIFELSNVAYELNNKYALFIKDENEILRRLIYNSSQTFPETHLFQIER